MRSTFAAAVILGALSTLTTACSGGPGGGGEGSGLETTYDVTYRPETVFVSPEDASRAVLDENDDQSSFTLDASVPGISSLAPGKVLLLGGIALRKIDGVVVEGGQVKVTTSPAALTDAIERGHLAWHGQPILSERDATLRLGLPETGVQPLARPVTHSLGRKGKIGDWEFEFVVKPAGDKVTIELSVSRSVQSLEVKLQATMVMDSPRIDGDIVIDGHATQSASLQTKGIKARVKASWSAGFKEYAGDTAFAEILKLPVDYPLPILPPLPLFLRLQANFAVIFGLTGEGTHAVGSISFDVDGEGGYSVVAGEAPKMTGAGTGSATVGPETNVSAVGDSALGVVINVPRVGISLGIPKSSVADMLAYVSVVTQIVTKASGVINPLPCKALDYKITTSTGLEAKLLGFEWKETKELSTVSQGSVRIPEGRKCGE